MFSLKNVIGFCALALRDEDLSATISSLILNRVATFKCQNRKIAVVFHVKIC